MRNRVNPWYRTMFPVLLQIERQVRELEKQYQAVGVSPAESATLALIVVLARLNRQAKTNESGYRLRVTGDLPGYPVGRYLIDVDLQKHTVAQAPPVVVT